MEEPSANHRRGFTLVELLVVISIIALLLAILMPTLNKVRAQGHQTICLSNMRQTGLGFLLYAQDYEGAFPRVVGAPSGAEVWQLLVKRWFLYPQYINNEKVFKCPAVGMNHPCIKYREKQGNPPYLHYNYLLTYFPYKRTFVRTTNIRPMIPMTWDMFFFSHQLRGINIACFDGSAKWLRANTAVINGIKRWKGKDDIQASHLMALDEFPAGSGWIYIAPSYPEWQSLRTVEQFNKLTWP
jgi:prepilin-type N-terminal cleavage/methylation domain-containing protein